ncbi:MAG TPA: 3-hydroxyacyl-CoA dehydrogenase NAD-binding domain-containing protein [Stellaceae bacterium]|nr:3-hydroxyacyl-CoA dehydrogenase NAD-binding domain-containing protein [Stellaceae bacterium]
MSTADLPLAEALVHRPALVVGGGRMGLAIAHILAAAGMLVTVVEPSPGIVEAAPERLRQISRARGLDEAIAGRVTYIAAIEDVGGEIGIAIEAAPENLDLKRDIFRRLEVACSPDTILATNTSVIPIARIAVDVSRRARIVGTHFWNPPYAVRLVEVIQAVETSDETVHQTMALLAEVGQRPVHVWKDIPGFIGNRLQHALKREAIALVQAGVCDAETIDTVVKDSFGARLGIMGPLEQSDLVGLALTLAIHETILPDLDVSRAPQKLLVDLVAAGDTGAKTGRGFRSWSPEERVELEQRLDRALLGKAGT